MCIPTLQSIFLSLSLVGMETSLHGLRAHCCLGWRICLVFRYSFHHLEDTRIQGNSGDQQQCISVAFLLVIHDLFYVNRLVIFWNVPPSPLWPPGNFGNPPNCQGYCVEESCLRHQVESLPSQKRDEYNLTFTLHHNTLKVSLFSIQSHRPQ